MYLSQLNKEEKTLFLGLAYAIATADRDYSIEEQNMIAEYCREMQVEFDEKTIIKSLDCIIETVNKISNTRVKKIFVFEAIGLAMVDKNYDDKERKIVSYMRNEFNLEKEFLQKCESAINEYIEFQNRINNLVLGE